MFGRYDSRNVYLNNSELYKNVFLKRNVNFIRHYETSRLKYPSIEEIQEFQIIGHIWKLGDAFWKLSERHYGEPELWWVIAFYNNVPTEHHVKIGETVYIPFPLEKVLRSFSI